MDTEPRIYTPPTALAALARHLTKRDNHMTTDPAEDAVRSLLAALGVDEGAHTADTPRRVAAAFRHQLAGYDTDPRAHLMKTFPGPPNPGLVVVRNIEVTSMCAHHLLPITGYATIAYRPKPGNPIVGLSKLSRVLEGYARRLQVQEQLGWQVATALQEALDPVGAACIITAEHGCMTLRGVMQKGTLTTTTALTGEWAVPEPVTDRDIAIAEHQRG